MDNTIDLALNPYSIISTNFLFVSTKDFSWRYFQIQPGESSWYWQVLKALHVPYVSENFIISWWLLAGFETPCMYQMCPRLTTYHVDYWQVLIALHVQQMCLKLSSYRGDYWQVLKPLDVSNVSETYIISWWLLSCVLPCLNMSLWILSPGLYSIPMSWLCSSRFWGSLKWV